MNVVKFLIEKKWEICIKTFNNLSSIIRDKSFKIDEKIFFKINIKL